MRILLLGGAVFLGRALTDDALQRGHDLTAFNRGRSGPDLPGVTVIRGDRTSSEDLEVLAERGPWDAVIDTSGMTTTLVEDSARALVNSVGRYVLISTVNVYKGWPVHPLDDSSPVREYTPVGPPGESDADEYGRLKAGAELAVTTTYGQRATLLRPGVILGPHENVGRLPWWLKRIEEGGRVLAPGAPDWPIQPIDVRDVAAFALDAVEQDHAGSYNLTAPIDSSTFGELLDLCQEVAGVKADLEWVPDAFLRAQGVPEWVGLPLWRDYPGTWHMDAVRARNAGLTCRPLAATVADTWEWVRGGIALEGERFAELGISREREAEILTAWDAHRG
ncbi:NAD-dependent epimerase/dehydratase family protein [Planomonospora algeriensis]